MMGSSKIASMAARRRRAFSAQEGCPGIHAGVLLLIALAACGPSPAAAPPAAAPQTTTTSPSSTTSTSTSTSTPTGPSTASPSPTGSAAARNKPSQIAARHVLIQWMGCQNTGPSVVRTREQALKVAREVLARAKAGEDFTRLAVEFSDEPNAGARGGSLGRFGHGQMVKEFEEAAFALAPGELSVVVETPFGFHIIQRTE
jgi:peptidyl-prolyl cis-trans isomerase NIMA-interacting 1